MASDEDQPTIVVKATRKEVEQFLQQEFPDLDLADVVVKSPPRLPGNNRGIESMIYTTIEFTAVAIAGGVIWDTIKEISKRLKKRFGEDNVQDRHK